MTLKRISSILLGCAAAIVFTSVLPAAEVKGNEGKGRYYFRQTCKNCHTKGEKGGEVTPLSKTIAQWRTYFTKATHNRGAEPLTKVMPAEQIRDVQMFLVAHAADSLQPETCGK